MQSIKSLQNKFRNAVENGNVKVVKTMLNTIPTFDPSFDDSSMIIVSIQCNQFKILELLLKNPRFDPSVNNNKALSLTAMFNSSDKFILLLLNDNRVLKKLNRSFKHNTAKRELIKYLLVDFLCNKYEFINNENDVEIYLQLL